MTRHREPPLGGVAIQSGASGASAWIASTQGRLAMTGLAVTINESWHQYVMAGLEPRVRPGQDGILFANPICKTAIPLTNELRHQAIDDLGSRVGPSAGGS